MRKSRVRSLWLALVTFVTAAWAIAAESELTLAWRNDQPFVTWPETKAEIGKRVDWHGLARSQTGLREIVTELVWTRILEEEGPKRGIAKRAAGEEMRFNYPYALSVEKTLTQDCVKPSDEAEAKRYFEAHPELFMTPVRARLSRIVVPEEAKHGEVPAAVWLQLEAAAIAQGVRTFEQTLSEARKLNPNELQGDLGYVVLEEEVPIVQALKKVKAGDVVGPYIDGGRVYLFWVQQKQEAQPIPWELAKGSAAEAILAHCRKTKLAEWKRTLFKNYGIRIDEAAIAQAYRNVGSALPKTGGPVIDKKAGKSEGQ